MIKMRVVSSLVFSMSLILCAESAFADVAVDVGASAIQQAPQGIRTEYTDCIHQHDVTNLQAGYCMNTEKSFQKKRLNESYQLLAAILSASQKKKLSIAQLAWVNQQNKETDFQISLYGRGDLISNLEIGEAALFKLCERANELMRAIDVVKK